MADAPEDPEEETERVTAESYGALDTTNADSECWMIRVPQKLAELWDKAPEGTDLGELVFTKGGGPKKVKPSIKIKVAEDLQAQQQHNSGKPATTTTIPLNYSLQAMTKKIPVMHPFVRNNNSSVQILGTVSRTANLQVEQDLNYRAMLKDRLVATNITSNRFVKPVEVSESVMAKQRTTAAVAPSRKRGFGDAIFKVSQRMQEAANSQESALQQQGKSKKARQFSPDQPIKSVLFELFGQQPLWTVKDLKSAAVAGGATGASTKKAEAEIRDVLREIGDYHRSGDQKNMWELRKEFRKQT